MKKLRCTKCQEFKSQTEYYQRSSNAGRGFERQCKECRKAYEKENFRAVRFGMTMDQYLEQLHSQDNKCAICQRPHGEDKWQVLHVDHCHVSGNNRGLLCNNCNKGLGQFKDSVELLKMAIQYLEKYHEHL